MNEFQKSFLKMFEAMCSAYNLCQFDFEKIIGKTEDYFVSKFKLKDKEFKVYLYETEAGFDCDGQWCIVERASVSTDEELLDAFRRVFERELNAPKRKTSSSK